MQDLLTQLKEHSIIVADTGDFGSIEKYQPRDATTNPSLLLKAAIKPEYSDLFDRCISDTKQTGLTGDGAVNEAMDRLAVAFGLEILKIVSHRVSTEVDATLSFDEKGTVEKARSLIGRYQKAGIDRERILIKIASTWEGICAAKTLSQEGIHCNLTLLFSKAQAIACAEAGVQLISPFVGRILDWYKKNTGKESYAPSEDPGVLSVTGIYHYYRKFGYQTEVMGASFRNKEEVLALAGCDLLTISPGLLEELQANEGTVERQLLPSQSESMDLEKISMDEKSFRWALNEDAMATEKLAEGIRGFAADTEKLRQLVQERLT